MSKRILAVPLNQQGVIDYETDISKTDNLQYFDFPDDEFYFLYDNGIIDKFNDVFGTLIDDYEEEIIKNEFLHKAKEIVSEYQEKVPCFFEALHFAIERNTQLGLEL